MIDDFRNLYFNRKNGFYPGYPDHPDSDEEKAVKEQNA